MTELGEWDSFYVIIGSAAGALIGLQFVVMSLIAMRPPTNAAEAAPAFATPTIVHFGTVLLVSALMRAPWHAPASIAIVAGLVGLAGVLYTASVIRRMTIQTAYRPELEDWIFHAMLPVAAYVAWLAAAMRVTADLRIALFAVAGASLVLLFAAIHNAWDAVTYHVLVTMREPPPAA